jgi:hypothetical protein
MLIRQEIPLKGNVYCFSYLLKRFFMKIKYCLFDQLFFKIELTENLPFFKFKLICHTKLHFKILNEKSFVHCKTTIFELRKIILFQLKFFLTKIISKGSNRNKYIFYTYKKIYIYNRLAMSNTSLPFTFLSNYFFIKVNFRNITKINLWLFLNFLLHQKFSVHF